ncbi:glycosyltransferase family 2 protein [Sneathiella marina]|uniref:Glycosyltransferase family 2 protein n=1 Tax=Sneathiella marina TaxID=2950108 RepID=A0ABY4W297_9PROT|nr:glycosyltransferase family 2 protein [Sneathiella marina]USG61310.1 glycosyltransferase family 2 protein [Sneathiella marina]
MIAKARKMKPLVSVIIVNWNVRDMVLDCIGSIIEQTRSTYEIIVVDNDSSDGSVDAIKDKFSSVKIIANDSNRGFAAANNQALAVSQGEYVLLLNPDTLVVDNAIDKMLQWIQQDSSIGCGGCQVFESENVIQNTCFSDMTVWSTFLVLTGLARVSKSSRFWGKPHYYWWDRRTEMEVDVVSGMFMLVPRKVLEEVGGMDDDFFVYAEEADWCRRIRAHGYRCVFTPLTHVVHRDGGNKSTDQILAKMYVQLQKSKLIYARKYYGLLGYLEFRFLYFASMLMRSVLFVILSLFTQQGGFRTKAFLAIQGLKFHTFGKEPSK